MNEVIESLRNEVKDSVDKLIIIINGDAKSGKTYLVNNIKGIPALDFNTIDTYKSLMVNYFNWDGQKDLKSRTILHELKKLHIEYNEGPLRKIVKVYNDFVKTEFKILFLHIGEAEEIEKVKYVMDGHCNAKTLLIQSPNLNSEDINDPRYGDNHPSESDYDAVYINDKYNTHSIGMFNGVIQELYDSSISKPIIYFVYPLYADTFDADQYIVNHNVIINKSYGLARKKYKKAVSDIFKSDFATVCSESDYIRYAINEFKKNRNSNESLIIEMNSIITLSCQTMQDLLKDNDVCFKLISLDRGEISDKFHEIIDIDLIKINHTSHSCLYDYKQTAVKYFRDYILEKQK